jgi:hypothetical protein
MAPGVVVSICYIMATGLTALAFIIERRGIYRIITTNALIAQSIQLS